MHGNTQERTIDCCQKQESKQSQTINHNGFTNSPPLTQVFPPILVILIFGLSMAQAHLIIKNTIIIVIFDGLLIGLLLVASVLWYQATKIIPTDSIQMMHLNAIEKGETFDTSKLSSYCQLCQTYINKNSFHCKKCRRCVQFFDHHCKWLNNCIGAKNYFQFYGLLLVTFALFIVCIALNAFILSTYGDSEETSFILAIIIIVLAGAPSGWLIYLISLHTYLIIAKRTTIELILENRKKNKIHPTNKANNTINKVIKFELSVQPVFKDQEAPSLKHANKTIFQDSNYETNHILIRNNLSDKQGIQRTRSPSAHKQSGKGLPPLKGKLQITFDNSKKNQSKLNVNPIFHEAI